MSFSVMKYGILIHCDIKDIDNFRLFVNQNASLYIYTSNGLLGEGSVELVVVATTAVLVYAQ